jgi:hypothetical protein
VSVKAVFRLQRFASYSLFAQASSSRRLLTNFRFTVAPWALQGSSGKPLRWRQAVAMQAFLARQQVSVELLGGAHFDGIVCAAAALVGVGLGEAQFGHRGQRIANSIRSISFLSIRP